MLNKFTFAVFILFLIVHSSFPKSVEAQSENNIKISADVGFDGLCKTNRWFPVRVVLENNGSDLEGRLEVIPLDLDNQWRFGQDVSLPSVSRKEIQILVYPRQPIQELEILYTSGEDTIFQSILPITCVQTDNYLYGVWSENPSAFSRITRITPTNNRSYLAQLTIDDIPEYAQGLEMIEGLIISDVDTGKLNSLQIQAIESWVTSGGRMVVTGGVGWRKTASGLSELLPFIPTDSLIIPSLTSLETFHNMGDGDLVGDSIISIGEAKKEGQVILSQEEIPLIVKREVGFGIVYYFTFDPSIPILQNWDGMENIYKNLLTDPLDNPTWSDGFTSWFSAVDAIANIPGLGLPSLYLICGFLGLYVFALGPFNYVILRRLKRKELAWVTVPSIIIIFCGFAIIAGYSIRGNRPIVNQLAIVQIWQGQEKAQLDGLVGIFSPNREKYNLEIGNGYLAHPIPSGRLSGGRNWWIAQNDNGVRISDIRIDVGGVEAVVINGQTPAPEFSPDVTLYSVDEDLILEGEIQNTSTISLRDAVLLGRGAIQRIGDFSPGDTETIRLSLAGNNTTPPSNSLSNPLSQADNTMFDLFGRSFVSSLAEPDLVRRFNLFQAAFGDNGNRGNGVYLIGWTNDFPLDITLNDGNFRSEKTAIYILSITPTVSRSQ